MKWEAELGKPIANRLDNSEIKPSGAVKNITTSRGADLESFSTAKPQTWLLWSQQLLLLLCWCLSISPSFHFVLLPEASKLLWFIFLSYGWNSWCHGRGNKRKFTLTYDENSIHFMFRVLECNLLQAWFKLHHIFLSPFLHYYPEFLIILSNEQ